MGLADTAAIGEALKRARLSAKRRQEEAAQVLGVSRVAVSNYERGYLPEDFTAEKLPRLASLYGVTPEAILDSAESLAEASDADRIVPNEPLERHIHKFPPAVQAWFFGFMSELLALNEEREVSADAIEKARRSITFEQLDLWAGGRLQVSDVSQCLDALRWCAEATWRNLTEPGWLAHPAEWGPLPLVFARQSETEERVAKASKSARPSARRNRHR